MSKRQRKPPSKPSNAYLVSFGDTMTAMLAFFIVLNTLAQEQTGANLHTGTGSFVNAMSSMGLPGKYSGNKSKRVQHSNDVAPKYIVNENDENEDGMGNGPDEEGNDLRVLDREYENLQRLVIEFDQLFDVKQELSKSNSIVFDVFDKIGKEPSLLSNNAKKILVRSMSALLQPDYRVEVKVWAATPSVTAMARSTKIAKKIKAEILRDFPILKRESDKVQASANLWPFSDARRPVLSVVIVRTITQTQE